MIHGEIEMKRTIVRYKVKPERAAENEELVRAVYDELRRVAPEGLRYATFKLDDGLSFVHVAISEEADARSPLTEIGAFKEFQRAIAERCDEPPVVSGAEEIGSFRLFGDRNDTR
jgi:hypothetical protein